MEHENRLHPQFSCVFDFAIDAIADADEVFRFNIFMVVENF